MCGIVGYVGHRDSVPIILDSLQRLEYRGYDSAGIAVLDSEGVLAGSKAEGKLHRLSERLLTEPLHGFTGLGHTRWATHGRPSDINAHPHLDCSSADRRDPQRDHRELRFAPRATRRRGPYVSQ